MRKAVGCLLGKLKPSAKCPSIGQGGQRSLQIGAGLAGLPGLPGLTGLTGVRRFVERPHAQRRSVGRVRRFLHCLQCKDGFGASLNGLHCFRIQSLSMVAPN